MSEGVAIIHAEIPGDAAEHMRRIAKQEGVHLGEIIRRGYILYTYYSSMRAQGFELSGTKQVSEGECEIIKLPSEPFLSRA